MAFDAGVGRDRGHRLAHDRRARRPRSSPHRTGADRVGMVPQPDADSACTSAPWPTAPSTRASSACQPETGVDDRVGARRRVRRLHPDRHRTDRHPHRRRSRRRVLDRAAAPALIIAMAAAHALDPDGGRRPASRSASIESLITLNLNHEVGVVNVFLFLGVLVMVLLLSRSQRARPIGRVLRSGVRQSADLRCAQTTLVGAQRSPAWAWPALLVLGAVIPLFVSAPSKLLVWTESAAHRHDRALAVAADRLGRPALARAVRPSPASAALSMLAFTRGQPMGDRPPVHRRHRDVHDRRPVARGARAGTALGVVFSVLVGLPALRVQAACSSPSPRWRSGHGAARGCSPATFWSGGQFTVPRRAQRDRRRSRLRPRPAEGVLSTSASASSPRPWPW